MEAETAEREGTGKKCARTESYCEQSPSSEDGEVVSRNSASKPLSRGNGEAWGRARARKEELRRERRKRKEGRKKEGGKEGFPKEGTRAHGSREPLMLIPLAAPRARAHDEMR